MPGPVSQMTSSKELIVPVFIPHSGCTHSCVFCNQNSITGSATVPGPDDVRRYLASRLGPDTPHAVVAFYGGSFTCLPYALQDAYLSVAAEQVAHRHARHVRLSTRPDCVDGEAASYLYSRGVRVVELGVQSMDDRVLAASARGHTAEDTVEAAGHLRAAGMELGMQVMAGLPSDTTEGFINTVTRVVSMNPDFVRVYPVLVVRGAPLEALYQRGLYRPLGLDDAVTLCARAVSLFRGAGIRVVRTGLQPSAELEAALVDGPYHPAFGHMVSSELALGAMVEAARREYGGAFPERVTFLVNPRELSEYLGIKKGNIERLKLLLGTRDVAIRADITVAECSLTVHRP